MLIERMAIVSAIIALAACTPDEKPRPAATPKAGVAYLTASGAIVIVCEGDPRTIAPEGQVLSRGTCVEVDGKRAIAPERP